MLVKELARNTTRTNVGRFKAIMELRKPNMNNLNPSTESQTRETNDPQFTAQTFSSHKRVILTMGGKGGVGKTSFMVVLAEWFESHDVLFTLLDLDTENKARGSLKHYFKSTAHKINIHTPAGLDAFVDYLEEGSSVILADMGAGSGEVTHEWFDTMHEDVVATGISFTAVGIVTPDPASVESVLSWASRLQDRVSYLIVENANTPQADFSYWRDSEQAQQFRNIFQPIVLAMKFRLPELENPARQHGATLGQILSRSVKFPELQKTSLVMRANTYRRLLFEELETAKDALLP
jgi:MinD-like ATPase involved in chromosome partitioning or flagellar assembly